MSSPLEQLLPGPFKYFKEQGFNEENPSKIPFCALKGRDRAYVAVKPPAHGTTGRFYQDSATGSNGGSFRNRRPFSVSIAGFLQVDCIDEGRIQSTRNRRAGVRIWHPEKKRQVLQALFWPQGSGAHSQR